MQLRWGNNIPLFSEDSKTNIFLDTNILLNLIKENWYLESFIQQTTTEPYKFVVPKFILEELKGVKEKRTVKNGAIHFVEEKTELLEDSKYLTESDYNKPIDDLLLLVAQKIPGKKYIMTQDMRLKDKILQRGIAVIFISYGKARILRS